MGKILTVFMIDKTEYKPRLSEIWNCFGRAIYNPLPALSIIISRISFIIILIILLQVVIGCASNPSISSLSPEQRARLNTIQIIKGGVDRPYKILGTVKGLSCQRTVNSTQLITEDEAIDGIRLEAALLGADAVINTVCQINSGTDWGNNCWSSIVCIGDAIKYKN